MRVRVVVTGGTGLLGRPLIAALRQDGCNVAVLTRSPESKRLGAEVEMVSWSAAPAGEGETPEWWQAVRGADAVIHLAGASIAGGRWDASQKDRIMESRVQGTRAVVQALANVEPRPPLLISGSATGYYGPHGDEVLTEQDPPGRDFLASVCRTWESEALQAEGLGVRVARVRTGLVLSHEGGAFPRLLEPFEHGIGGPLGSGQQWMSWIHWQDWVDLVRALLQDPQATGAFNAVAPEPVTNRRFARALGEALHRPAWMPVPGLVLRLMAGEMADALLLAGQRVMPERAQEGGFRFSYPELESALADLVGKK